MAGNSIVGHAEGRLSLVRERGTLRVGSQPIVQPLTFILSLTQPERRRDAQESAPPRRYATGHETHDAQYPVGGLARNHFKLCDFMLVTRSRLQY